MRRWVCDWINYYAEIADKKRFPQLFDSELGISEELLDEWEIKVLLFHFLNWLGKRISIYEERVKLKYRLLPTPHIRNRFYLIPLKMT